VPARIGKDRVRLRYARQWDDLLGVLTDWAQEVVEYERMPDLWADRKASSELVATIQVSEIDNTPFTIDEQYRIAEVFAAIRRQLRERDDLTPGSSPASRVLRGVAHMFGVDFPLLPLAS
jgi:hypothetical protein